MLYRHGAAVPANDGPGLVYLTAAHSHVARRLTRRTSYAHLHVERAVGPNTFSAEIVINSPTVNIAASQGQACLCNYAMKLRWLFFWGPHTFACNACNPAKLASRK